MAEPLPTPHPFNLLNIYPPLLTSLRRHWGQDPVAILAYAAGAMNRPRQRLPRDDIHRVTVEIDAEQQPVEEH